MLFFAIISLTIMLCTMVMESESTSDAEAPARSGAGRELSFALYGAANRMARLHKPLLEPLGLTFSQYLVLLELFAGTPRTVGDLGAKLGMDTGTITPILKRIATAGMVTRTRDVADERRVLIALTLAGEALREQVQVVSGQVRSACKLDEQEIVELRGTLNALAWPAAGRLGDQ